MKCRSNGYSLVELAVAMAAAGVVGLVVWKWVATSDSIARPDPVATQLAAAQQGLEGFVLSHSRLPCPAADTSGVESCGVSGASVLPWKVLGLRQQDAVLKYGVYRAAGADLTLAGNTAFIPNFPPGVMGEAAPGYNGVTTSNGLDFCTSLRRAAAAPSSGTGALAVDGMAVAYALVHPGANGHFDGKNVTGFDLPGRPGTASYDDQMQTAGLSELSGRLTCPQRLGAVNAAVRSTYAAYDIWRNTKFHQTFRTFDNDFQQTQLTFSRLQMAIDVLNLAMTAAAITTGTLVSIESGGVGVASVVSAVAAAVAAVLPLVLDAIALAEAEAGAKTAQQMDTASQGLTPQMLALLNAKAARAAQQDLKGLLP